MQIGPYSTTWRMRRYAKKAIRGESTIARAAAKLRDAVGERTKYQRKYILSNHRYKTARETFRSKKGNCLDQTILYVALARSLGIKARVVKYNDMAHIVPVVDTEPGLLIFDTTNAGPSEVKYNPKKLTEVSDLSVIATVERGNWLRKAKSITKAAAFSAAISITLNMTQEHWYPHARRTLDLLEDKVTDMYQATDKTCKKSIKKLHSYAENFFPDR